MQGGAGGLLEAGRDGIRKGFMGGTLWAERGTEGEGELRQLGTRSHSWPTSMFFSCVPGVLSRYYAVGRTGCEVMQASRPCPWRVSFSRAERTPVDPCRVWVARGSGWRLRSKKVAECHVQAFPFALPTRYSWREMRRRGFECASGRCKVEGESKRATVKSKVRTS